MYRTLFQSFAAALMSATALSAFIAAPAAQAGIKGSTSEVNVDERGVALAGYDPVAYFDSGKPTRGLDTISASYGGARYLFATAKHRKAFLANPRNYVPEFGGFCATGTAFGEKVDIDPETGKVVNGKLYLNNGPKALQVFNQNTPDIIAKAQVNWPTVKDKAL
jgi:hypothetical protein